MSTEIITDADHKMARAVEAMERDFEGIRTGRASTSLVERIHVEYYGTSTPLNQLAGISVPEPHQIVIQPWDRGVLGAIEKAITKSDIGLMPNVDGTVVRLNIPPLTEERRKDLVRVVHKRMEEAKGRDPQPAPRRRGPAQEGRARRRRRDRRGAPPARDAPAHDRPAHRRRRPPRDREGTGGPRGLVARPPTWPGRPMRRPRRMSRRPTRPVRGDPRRPASVAPAARRAAAPRRDHHGRQPPLGTAARPARARRPRRRRRGHPGLLRHAVRRGVPVLTLYAFSRENWARSDEEVTGLFGLLEAAIRSETEELRAQGVRIRLLGRLDELPDATRASIGEALDATAGGERLLLNIAFNYAGRTELVDAFRRLAASGDRRRRTSTRRTIGARPLHGRTARPGPRHPDRRRAAPVELPDLAVGLRRVLHLRDALAGLRAGRVRRRAPRVREPPSSLRSLTPAGQEADASASDQCRRARPGPARRPRPRWRRPRRGRRDRHGPRRRRGLPPPERRRLRRRSPALGTVLALVVVLDAAFPEVLEGSGLLLVAIGIVLVAVASFTRIDPHDGLQAWMATVFGALYVVAPVVHHPARPGARRPCPRARRSRPSAPSAAGSCSCSWRSGRTTPAPTSSARTSGGRSS